MSNYEVSKKWSVSHWNYCDELIEELKFAQQIKLHDQTLRDGTQFSGIEFSEDEKVEIAARLIDIGVQRIEAGRISDDPKHLDTVKRITALKRSASVMGFVELSVDLVKHAADCGVDGVMICFPSNEKAITEKMGSTVKDVTDIAVKMVETSNSLGLKTVLFPTDASRAEPKHYKQMITNVLGAGEIDALTFVDTIGACSPRAIPHIIKFLRTITDKPLEVHFHNDFGLAAANTVAALSYGVSVAHTTVLGIGERAGNAPMEQVAMILRTMYGKDLSLKLNKLYKICNYVSKAAALPVPENKPIVGDKIFEIECLENLAGYIKVPEDVAVEYTFPFKWDVVGNLQMNLAMGAESTMEVLEYVLKSLGISSIEEQTKSKLLEYIQRKAILEKCSFSKDGLQAVITGYINN